jgi:hypothetical protein
MNFKSKKRKTLGMMVQSLFVKSKEKGKQEIWVCKHGDFVWHFGGYDDV